MNPNQIRVRFAPSPTGYLHVGGARTALFNWLLARHHNGVFVLRIEDTDRQRSSDEMTQVILEGMQWLGLDWDEGPIHQADGLDRHRADALRMLDNGNAYRCFCTPEELDRKRAAATAESGGYKYDRACLSIPPTESDRRAESGEKFTVRFRVPDGTTSWLDAVHGEIAFPNADLEDFIVLRSDGTPIYNMAVVSDDIEMRITHVIRGDDHISNTPKQILIYQALGAALPVFAHVPMILGPDGKKLSKRHGATAVGDYRLQGILPDAMRNFLALLGWSPGDDREIMEVEELIAAFSLEGINKKSAVFDLQKLEWMNGQYINRIPVEELAPLVTELLQGQSGIHLDGRLQNAIELAKPRARTIADLANQAAVYLKDTVDYDRDAVAKHWADGAAVRERLEKLRAVFEQVDGWTPDVLERALRATAESMQIGAAKLIHPLRVALTGSAVSPGIFDVLVVLGRDTALARIDTAVRALSAR